MSAVATTLRELATLGATGALHVEAFSGAVVYLRDGTVTHIDAASAPGIGTLLTASGRLSKDVWESVVTVGAATGRVAALLVEQGYLSQGELELCVNGALFDAAYFALTLEPTSVRFSDGERSWFGGALRVDVERLVREVAHRQDQLTRVFPTPEFDDAALTLVARLPKDQVVVDGLRWELLLHADGRRTPLELARIVGRGAYATLLEVRRLAAIGLALPPSATGAAARPAVTPYRPAAGSPVAKSKPPNGAPAPLTGVSAPVDGVTPEPPLPRRANGTGPEHRGGDWIQPLPPLPRRIPSRVVRPSQQGRSGQEPGEPASVVGDSRAPRWLAPPPEVYAEVPSISSLRRFRDALQGFS